MSFKRLNLFILLVLLLWPYPGFGGAEPLETGLEKDWGIRIIAIRQSAAGYMLDFRCRVLDPKKAAPLFDRQTKPYLVDQASGKKFRVPNLPKVGPLRSSNIPQTDRIYALLFGNPGRFIHKGNKVTVVIGDFKAADLVVK